VSFSSDWLYLPEHMKNLSLTLGRNRKQVSYANIQSSYGHDAFLLEVDKLTLLVRNFLGEVGSLTINKTAVLTIRLFAALSRRELGA
jgi:homoserine O-acetyltransferase